MNREQKIQELLDRNRLFYAQNCYSDTEALKQATKDFEIITNYLVEFNKNTGLRVGDLLEINEKDEHFRVAHDWGKSLQTTYSNGSFCLGNGYVSHSGSLHLSIPAEFLELQKDKEFEAIIWVFSNGQQGAHRGVYLRVPFRVYRISRSEEAINYMIEKMKMDLLPEDHPVMVCDRESPQFKLALTEYFLLRNAGMNDVALTKDCVFKY